MTAISVIAGTVVSVLYYGYFAFLVASPILFVLRLLIPRLQLIPICALAIGLALLLFLYSGTRLPASTTPVFNEIVLKRRARNRLKRPPERVRPMLKPLLAWEIIDDEYASI